MITKERLTHLKQLEAESIHIRHAEIMIDTDTTSVDESVRIIVKYIKENCIK